MRALLFLAFVFGLSISPLTRVRDYDFSISSKFSEVQRVDAWEAARLWEAAISVLRFHYVGSECTHTSKNPLICVEPATIAELSKLMGNPTVGTENPEPTFLHVRIAVDQPEPDFRQVVEHELGHAMGLPHCNEREPSCRTSIMYWQTIPGITKPTQTDVWLWYSVQK